MSLTRKPTSHGIHGIRGTSVSPGSVDSVDRLAGTTEVA